MAAIKTTHQFHRFRMTDLTLQTPECFKPLVGCEGKGSYIANCIADWTAGTPPPQGRRSYDRHRY